MAGPLEVSWSELLLLDVQGHPEQVAQVHVQVDFGDLQGGRLHNRSLNMRRKKGLGNSATDAQRTIYGKCLVVMFKTDLKV